MTGICAQDAIVELLTEADGRPGEWTQVDYDLAERICDTLGYPTGLVVHPSDHGMGRVQLVRMLTIGDIVDHCERYVDSFGSVVKLPDGDVVQSASVLIDRIRRMTNEQLVEADVQA